MRLEKLRRLNRVSLDYGTPEEQLRELEADLCDIGASARVSAGIIALSVPEVVIRLASVTGIGIPIASFFKKYAEVLGEEAGRSTAAGVRWLFRKISQRRGPRGQLDLTDISGVSVIISSETPSHAIDLLDYVDWETITGGTLGWDTDKWIYSRAPGEIVEAPMRPRQ